MKKNYLIKLKFEDGSTFEFKTDEAQFSSFKKCLDDSSNEDLFLFEHKGHIFVVDFDKIIASTLVEYTENEEREC